MHDYKRAELKQAQLKGEDLADTVIRVHSSDGITSPTLLQTGKISNRHNYKVVDLNQAPI